MGPSLSAWATSSFRVFSDTSIGPIWSRHRSTRVYGLFEEVRVEQGPKHRLDLEVGAHEGLRDEFNGIRVPGRLDGPGRHLGLVGHEEGVEVARDKPGKRLLLTDDVYDVLSVEATRMPQEGLLGAVVVLGARYSNLHG